MKQNYVIVKQETINSRFGGEVVRITIVGTADRFEYLTYVDVRNQNVKNWWHIINHPLRGYVISGVTIKKDNIINADSDPIIFYETDNANELFSEVLAVWRDQDADRRPDHFRRLFD